ncbi:MAG: type 4a pilus biogenesis protein PilO [Gemmatimonadota bacterium]|jgi:Tfp pilus assembly protein PilO
MALLPTDPQNQKKLILGLLPLLVFFVYQQLFHGKRVAQADNLEQRLEILTTTNNAAKVLAAQGGPELERRLAIYEQHMRQLEELIPNREEVPELLYSMSLRMQAAGVEMSKMHPEAEDPGPFYTRQIYELGVKGTYHNVGAFLTEVGLLPRIVTPTDLKIAKAVGNPLDRSGDPILEANFRIVTYVIPDPVSVSADSVASHVSN